MDAAPIVIGIAVVDQSGRYLVGVRPDDVALPGLCEFPGGKCRPGETPAECAVRECREETGLAVEPVASLATKRHRYPHGEVELHFWLCRPRRSADVAESHRGFTWVPAAELASLPFPEANAGVIELLSRR